MRANLQTAMVSARAVLPSMMEGGGSIVMVASIGAISSGPESAVYTAAKTGLVGLVRSIAVDYGRYGVRANAVLPGPTRSPMSDGIVGEYAAHHGISRDDAYAELGAHVPLPGAKRARRDRVGVPVSGITGFGRHYWGQFDGRSRAIRPESGGDPIHGQEAAATVSKPGSNEHTQVRRNYRRMEITVNEERE